MSKPYYEASEKPVKNTPWPVEKPITTKQGKEAFEKVFVPKQDEQKKEGKK